jgi:hypothetical protein
MTSGGIWPFITHSTMPHLCIAQQTGRAVD